MDRRDQSAVDRLVWRVRLAVEALGLAARLRDHQRSRRVVPRLGHAVEVEVGPARQDLVVFRAGAIQSRDSPQRPSLAGRKLAVELFLHLVADEADRWPAWLRSFDRRAVEGDPL